MFEGSVSTAFKCYQDFGIHAYSSFSCYITAAFGAVLHVVSTSLLGITAITMANTIAGEERVHKLASLLLIVLGGSYILLFLLGKGGHSHSHNHPMEKMAVAGLVLVPALSPCATTLPVFLAVGNSSSMMVLAIIVLLFRYEATCTNTFTSFWLVEMDLYFIPIQGSGNLYQLVYYSGTHYPLHERPLVKRR